MAVVDTDPPQLRSSLWRRNLTMMRVLAFFQFALVIIPVIVPIMKSYGLSMAEIMFTQTVFGISTLLLEVPSGVFADRYGRCVALLLGGFLVGVTFTILFFARSFEMLCLFEVFAALGLSLMSGADTSLAFESEKALGLSVGTELEKIHGWYSWGEAVAALISVWVLLYWDFSMLLWLQLFIGWIVFLCVLPLREPKRKRVHSQRTLPNTTRPYPLLGVGQHVRDIFVDFSQVPHLPVLLLFYLSICAWTYFSFWSLQPLLTEHAVPEMAFGLVYALMHVSTGLSSRWTTAFRKGLTHYRSHFLLPVVLVVSYVLFQIHWLGAVILAGVATACIRGIVVPLVKVTINEQVADDRRATLNSVVAALFRLMTALLGPIFGASIDHFGVRPTLLGMIVFVVPGLFILVLWQYRIKKGLQASLTA